MKGREENEVLDAEESFAIRSYIEAAKKLGIMEDGPLFGKCPVGRNLVKG